MTRELVTQYKRDKRSPIPKNPAVSRVMSANRGKNSKPEILFRKALWSLGIRGYRLHYKRLPGNPDLAFVSKKTAIFIHGCFWHRCPKCAYKLPNTNRLYWKNKFQKNVERDRRHLAELRRLGWHSIVIWECDIKKSAERMARRTRKKLDQFFIKRGRHLARFE